jgi:hypothetical protein
VYQNSDMFPFYREGMPTVLIEACAVAESSSIHRGYRLQGMC